MVNQATELISTLKLSQGTSTFTIIIVLLIVLGILYINMYNKINESLIRIDESESRIDNNLRGNSGYHAYHLGLFKKDVVFPLKTIKFNDISYPCPNDTDFYLRDLYKEYNKIPKVVVHHFRADNLNRKYDDEFFDNEIKKFEQINQNFGK